MITRKSYSDSFFPYKVVREAANVALIATVKNEDFDPQAWPADLLLRHRCDVADGQLAKPGDTFDL